MNKLQCYHFDDGNRTEGLLFEFKDEPFYNSCYSIGYRDKKGLCLLYMFLSPQVKTSLNLSIYLPPRCAFKTELVTYDFLITLSNQTDSIVGYYEFNKPTLKADLLTAELINLVFINWDNTI